MIIYENMSKPFLWNYITSVKQSPKSSGGEERPLTASVNEENSPCLIEFSE